MRSVARTGAGPDPQHLARLGEGVAAWNRWRAENPGLRPVLDGAALEGAALAGYDLHDAQLLDTLLCDADLDGANLRGARIERCLFNGARLGSADLRGAVGFSARFIGCDLRQCRFGGGGFFDGMFWDADLRGCDLRHCNFSNADFIRARLDHADFSGCTLDGVRWSEVQGEGVCVVGASMTMATVSGALLRKLRGAGVDLSGSRVVATDFAGADLQGANLQLASLVNVRLQGADLSGSRVFGVGAWHLDTAGARQQDLRITLDDPEQPLVACDDLETAQFVYLLLHNEKLRQVIDTVGRKAVLLLGRFTAERKAVLDALRVALRGHGLVPLLFDFEKPGGRDITETMSTLAHLARFVIADLTDPRSIPQELKAVVPALPSVPVVPLLHASQDAYAMFADLGGYASVLPPVRYHDLPQLLGLLAEGVIAPAERRIAEIQARRAAFEAALAPPPPPNAPLAAPPADRG